MESIESICQEHYALNGRRNSCADNVHSDSCVYIYIASVLYRMFVAFFFNK